MADDATFRPKLFLLEGCPFCFKVRLFLLEADLADDVDKHWFAAGTPENDAVRQELALHLTKVSFPAAELEPDRYVADSEEIIRFLSDKGGVDPEALPVLRLYVDGPLRQVSTL